MNESECIFCKISRGEIPAEKIIYENDNFFSIPDKSPLVKGHSLVISKKHFKTALDLPIDLGTELLDCIKNTSLRVINETKAEGFNVVSNNFGPAGQIVHHVHFHIIPRKKGDNIKLFEKT